MARAWPELNSSGIRDLGWLEQPASRTSCPPTQVVRHLERIGPCGGPSSTVIGKRSAALTGAARSEKPARQRTATAGLESPIRPHTLLGRKTGNA